MGGWGITLVRMSLDKCGINGDCSRQYAPNLITKKDMGMGTSCQRQAGMEPTLLVAWGQALGGRAGTSSCTDTPPGRTAGTYWGYDRRQPQGVWSARLAKMDILTQ